jgi:hypothetical protein
MMHLGTLHQVPLHLSAFDREPSLKLWVQHWFADDPIILTPLEWFTLGHTNGSFIWSPPPAAADAALEQLAAAIRKRPYNTHLVIIPRLMTANWRRLLYKICDLVFTVPLGANFWPTTHFEPLLVGLSFPQSLAVTWNTALGQLLDFYWGGAYFAPTSLTNATIGNPVRKHGAESATRHLI